jgi:hypothetical protein
MAENTTNSRTRNSVITEPYNGIGEYVPFSGDLQSGSVFTPPTIENPFFVLPSYSSSDLLNLKVNLASNDSSEFLEDDISIGIGSAVSKNYAPSLKFGNKKTYKARRNGFTLLNYFEVVVEKTYQTNTQVEVNSTLVDQQNLRVRGTNTLLDFNYSFTDPARVRTDSTTQNDILYKENIKIKEYRLDKVTKEYKEYGERNLDSTNGSFRCDFEFEDDNEPGIPKPVDDIQISYTISFTSNFKSELGDILNLTYKTYSSTNDLLSEGVVKLVNGVSDKLQIKESFTKNGYTEFYINTGGVPKEYSIVSVNNTSKIVAQSNPNDFTKWNQTRTTFNLPNSVLVSSPVIAIIYQKETLVEKPTITLPNDYYDVEIKESDTEKIANIAFTTKNADYVNVYVAPNKFVKVNSNVGFVDLFFVQDFNGEYGSKKVIFQPVSELYGTGDSKEIIVKFLAVNDFPALTQVRFPDLIEVPSFSDLQIEYDVDYSTFAATSVDVALTLKDGSKTILFSNLSPNGKFTINLKKLSDTYPLWSGKDTINLIFKPYNKSGVKELIGNEYEVITKVVYPTLNLDEDSIRKTLYDGFESYLDNLILEEPEKESKYLTHLTNFGNDEQILISSWENDNYTLSEKSEDAQGNEIITKEVKSLILRLYEPLPTNFNSNDTLWITKLIVNSIIETIVLTDEVGLSCPPIKGPNFNVGVDYVTGKSTDYESLDTLILSSSTAEQLVSTYLSSSAIDFDDINIQYTSGSTYLWNNFIHFSSARERLDNFVYKVQLIETYESLIISSSTDVTNTSGNASDFTASLASQQEVERNKQKKAKLIQGFDGFENFLYTSASLYTTSGSNSMTWPYSGSVRYSSNDLNVVLPWYNNISQLATNYDKENSNYIINNIPQYIKNNDDNESFLLFFSMIGQYFDTFYYYTKAIENSRQLGYKDNGELANKLIYDYLLSLGFDVKHLSVDSKLWQYAFGYNDDGIQIEDTPAKKRTYEVWRRIINNLPYLLKHKGTRRGINALLSCYGIPASNLSLFEFGGPAPEVTSSISSKGKFEMENVTYYLQMNSGSYLQTNWTNTNKNRKPDTIELFLKPAYSGEYTIISGSNWNIKVSGSIGSNFGKAELNILENGSSVKLQSNEIPIFNGKMFGIKASRDLLSVSQSIFNLYTCQTENDNVIFSSSIDTIVSSSNWDSGSTIKVGTNYTGSLDEFRLWAGALSSSIFIQHNLFPEMINGNHFSSSTDDLMFRLDMEYPKNLGAVNPSRLINVAANIKLSGSLTRNNYEDSTTYSSFISTNPSASFSASAYDFTSISNYPYNFEPVERKVIVSIPDGIGSRYVNDRVRFEEKKLVSDLSAKSRSTEPSTEMAPKDSTRMGAFFSPTKELNIDIAKSIGEFNLSDYIGDPSDKYNSEYKRLGKLRNYYFERVKKKDVYQYLNIVSLYENSLFDNLTKLMPGRAKTTTGILIEPHFLERSKIKLHKPNGDYNTYEGTTNYDVSFDNEYNTYDALITTDDIQPSADNLSYETSIVFDYLSSSAENISFDTIINTQDDLIISSENLGYNATIGTGVNRRTLLEKPETFTTIVGMDDYDRIGFGLYAESGGFAVQTYFDTDSVIKKRRVRACLVKEQKTITTSKFKVLLPDGTGDPRGGTEVTSSIVTETKLNIQPFTGSNGLPSELPTITGSIISVIPIKGYLPVHHRYTKDTTRGLDNSFFKGSKNIAATTIDGSSPVEIFATNPNTLIVNKAGRSSSEPILEVGS